MRKVLLILIICFSRSSFAECYGFEKDGEFVKANRDEFSYLVTTQGDGFIDYAEIENNKIHSQSPERERKILLEFYKSEIESRYILPVYKVLQGPDVKFLDIYVSEADAPNIEKNKKYQIILNKFNPKNVTTCSIFEL